MDSTFLLTLDERSLFDIDEFMNQVQTTYDPLMGHDAHSLCVH
jgi:hypothetical protein